MVDFKLSLPDPRHMINSMNLEALGLVSVCLLSVACVSSPVRPTPEQEVVELLERPEPFVSAPQQLFDRLGWSLPDGGQHVKALADAAPGSAFDPAELEQLPSELGYSARWHVLRYPYYGIDWDITALALTPQQPQPGLPTLAIIHGGSGNWYEFFVDPLNHPGLAQYLAQRVPVILLTIPGNFKPGGWTEANAERIPAYLLDQPLASEEAKIRNAIFTFRLIAEGVTRMLEEISTGPLLIVGHSTGGEFQFMLNQSSLAGRLNQRFLGWGSGPPAHVKRDFDEGRGARAARLERYEKRFIWDVWGRTAEGYVSSRYIGPLNPVPGDSALEVAQNWFERAGRRRPSFKQTIQDWEHQGILEHTEKLAREIRQTLDGNPHGIDPDEVIGDLFVPSKSPLEGYQKMVWVVSRLDRGHWTPDAPEKSLEVYTADRFREANPAAAIRVLLLDAPVTHYGHIERPKQVAGALLAAAGWVID